MTERVVSVVIPTLNEAANIEAVIDRTAEALRHVPHEIVVVDDDSADETWRVAFDHGSTYRRGRATTVVKVIRRMNRRGLASAALDGLAQADGSALAVMDGDGQHCEAMLPDLLREVYHRGADIAVCARPLGFKPWGCRDVVTNLGAGLARLAVPRLGLTSDPLSGFFVMSRDRWRQVRRQHPPPPGRGFKVLWPMLACGPEPVVHDLQARLSARLGGASKLSAGVLAADLSYLFQLARKGAYHEHARR